MTSFEAADSALLYHAHHALHPEDLPFWLAVAQQAGDPILELGCGTGRVLLPLARAGHSVLGVDSDPEMLGVLRETWPGELGEAPVVQADFTRLELGRRFGLALLPCNTYSTLAPSERRALLDGLGKHLEEAGLFVVSMPNPLLLRDLPRRSPLEVEESFPHPLHGAPVQVSSGWQRSPTQFVLRWQYDYTGPDGDAHRVGIEVRHWLTPVDRLMEEFGQAGLQVMAVYGDYGGEAFEAGSPQLIVVCKQG